MQTASQIAEIENDARCDRWNQGALDAFNGKRTSSADIDYSKGYLYGLDQRKVRAVMPERREGYYHVALAD